MSPAAEERFAPLPRFSFSGTPPLIPGQKRLGKSPFLLYTKDRRNSRQEGGGLSEDGKTLKGSFSP